jgi:hypothetical protein
MARRCWKYGDGEETAMDELIGRLVADVGVGRNTTEAVVGGAGVGEVRGITRQITTFGREEVAISRFARSSLRCRVSRSSFQ